MLLAELHNAQQQKAPVNYILMVVQALCSCMFNNCPLTLHTVEQEGQTIAFFTALMGVLPKMKKEFEIRRVLFGLVGIIRTPIEHLPPLVASKLPDLFKEVGSLAVKIFNERKSTLQENEEYLAKGMPEGSDHDDYDSESDDCMYPEEMDSSEAFQQFLKASGLEELHKEAMRHYNGCKDTENYRQFIPDEKELADTKEKLKQAGVNEDDYDDENDSDYEVEGDDNGLYDSNLDEVDELLHLKETVDTLNGTNPAFFSHLTSLIAPDDLNRFADALNNAQELKAREEKCTKDIDAAEAKQREKMNSS